MGPEAELGECQGGKVRLLWRDCTTLLEKWNGPDDGFLLQAQHEFIPPAQGNVGPVCQVGCFVDGAEDKPVVIFGKNGAEATSGHDDTATPERLPGCVKGMSHGRYPLSL